MGSPLQSLDFVELKVVLEYHCVKINGMKIINIYAREIFDSRGLPTVECELVLENGIVITASVPAGASRSIHEARELRDGGKRLMGKGVQQAVQNIENIIASALIGKEPNIVQMDVMLLELDGTDDKSKLGANTLLAVSSAVCKAHALCESLTLYELIAYVCGFEMVALPCPAFNIINGGVHADNKLQTQEIMIMPLGESSFRAAMETGVTIFHALKKLLTDRGKSTNVGDEGGFAPDVADEQEALDLLMEAIELVASDKNIMIALDIAASQFYKTESQTYSWYGKDVSADQLISWYTKLLDSYPIYSIEDGLGETDWDNWVAMTKALDSRVKVIGDDIFVTNVERIWQGIERKAAHGALIKPNQIGTVTESLQAAKLCKEYDWDVIVSHRSGETNDSFIADLAVGVGATQIKAGGCSRGERMAKYNRLLKIEDELLMGQNS